MESSLINDNALYCPRADRFIDCFLDIYMYVEVSVRQAVFMRGTHRVLPRGTLFLHRSPLSTIFLSSTQPWSPWTKTALSGVYNKISHYWTHELGLEICQAALSYLLLLVLLVHTHTHTFLRHLLIFVAMLTAVITNHRQHIIKSAVKVRSGTKSRASIALLVSLRETQAYILHHT